MKQTIGCLGKQEKTAVCRNFIYRKRKVMAHLYGGYCEIIVK